MPFLCCFAGSVSLSHGAARSSCPWAAWHDGAPYLEAAAQPAAEEGAGLFATRGGCGGGGGAGGRRRS